MHHLVTPLAVAMVGALIVAGCGSQNLSRPTAISRDDAIALGSHPAATEFGTLTAGAPGAPGAGSTIDLAACLGLSPAESCFSAMPATVLGTAAALSAPSAPSNLVVTAVGGTVTLRWTPPAVAETAVVSYIIEAGSFPGAANLANFSTGNAVPSFFASGVGNGIYYVRVRAVNSGGPSVPSNEATLVVGSGPCAPPSPPNALVVVTNSGGTVGLSWGAASGVPTSYIVEAGSSPGLTNLANSNLGLTTSLTATGVGAGTYYVRIRARNACGTGAASNEVVLTVGVPIPIGNITGTWDVVLTKRPGWPYYLATSFTLVLRQSPAAVWPNNVTGTCFYIPSRSGAPSTATVYGGVSNSQFSVGMEGWHGNTDGDNSDQQDTYFGGPFTAGQNRLVGTCQLGCASFETFVMTRR